MSHTRNRASSRKALALIVVVYVLAALGTLAFALAFRSRIGLWQTQLVMDGTQRDQIALAACAQAHRLLATDDPNIDSFEDVWSRWHAMEMRPIPGDANLVPWEVHWRLQDESAKINLNLASADMLLKIEGLDEAVVGSILDWIDGDDIPNPSGAETQYYASLSPPYACKNGPLEILEELMFIKGVTPDLYFGSGRGVTPEDPNDPVPGQDDGASDRALDMSIGLRDMLTVCGDGKINLNTTLPVVLRAIPFLSDRAINEILSRQQSTSRKLTALKEIEADDTFSLVDKIVLRQVARFNSNHFQLHIKMRPQGTSSFCEYNAVLERDGDTVRVLNWQRRLPRMQQGDFNVAANPYGNTSSVD